MLKRSSTVSFGSVHSAFCADCNCSLCLESPRCAATASSSHSLTRARNAFGWSGKRVKNCRAFATALADDFAALRWKRATSFCVGSCFAHSFGGSCGSLASSTVCQARSAAVGLLSLVAAGAAAPSERRMEFIIRRQTETTTGPEPKRDSVKEEDGLMTATRKPAVTQSFPVTTFPLFPPDCRGHSSRGGRRA